MPDHPQPPASEVPDRVRLPLLSLITQQSLDEDYLHAAERRAAAGAGPARSPSHRTAAVQTSRNAGVDDASRATLIEQIVANRASVSRMQHQIVRRRQRNVELGERNSQLTRTEQASVARLRRLEVRTGFSAVIGQGVRIIVDDAADGDETQVVRDKDLRLLVDGLWNAGAEAISINGQRLTGLSSIRNVNVAVHVNSRPLSPPYVVLAIGNTLSLQADLFQTTHGIEFSDLARQLDFVFDMQNEESLSLPAARLRQLRDVVAGTAEENRDKHMNEETTP